MEVGLVGTVGLLVWLARARLPSLAALRRERERVRVEYEARLKTLDERYAKEWETDQRRWNRLLVTSGNELKQAVKEALEAFGWSAVDVDDYWKAHEQPDRLREEDLWLAEDFEPHPESPDTWLVEVKSSQKRTASDDDYFAVVKYLNRRKTEFANPALRGMLIVYHSYLTPAVSRPSAFSPAMVDDALRDGVSLVTTWDLFR